MAFVLLTKNSHFLFDEMYFDNLLTLPGDPENLVEQGCKENGWDDIVAKLVT